MTVALVPEPAALARSVAADAPQGDAVPRPGAGAPLPRRVALYVDFSDGWLGGLNYFKNLIQAVGELPGRPLEFVVLTGSRVDERLLDGFPRHELVRDPLFDRMSWRWVTRKLWQKYRLADPPLQALLERHRVDVLSHSGYLGRASRIPSIGWVPDFQHLHLPDVFRRWDIVRRDAEIARIVRASTRVVVSSESARADLLGIAPGAGPKTDVLRFVGQAPKPARLVDLATLRQRHGFDGDYVFLPNQYWSHKNHLTVIRAVARLREQGRRLTVVSTGKTDDFRQPAFFQSVRDEIARLGVADDYKVLGIVPYDDVVSLMHHAAYVINPSRFEGWSTTVEEAKAAGRHILLSDIPVHREQAPASADFFPATDVERLQALMWARWTQRPAAEAQGATQAPTQAQAHAERRRAFAETYVDIVERAWSQRGRA